jgi:hypothetical protein
VVPSAPEAPESADLPPPNSPGTLRELGPHVWEAVYEVRSDAGGSVPSRETTMRLVWAELDHYESMTLESGELRGHTIRVGRDIWSKPRAGGPFFRSSGVPGDSRILFYTLQFWDQAFHFFESQAAWERLPDADVDGRPAHVYRITRAPAQAAESGLPESPEEAAARLGLPATLVALEGRVWIDAATGNRLVAEFEGRYVPRGGSRPSSAADKDPTAEVHVSYRETRSLTPLPPQITPPPQEEVEDRRSSELPRLPGSPPRQPQRPRPAGGAGSP